MTKREQLISEIEAFCLAKGLSDREFSEIAVQNPKFMPRLRRNVVTSRSMETAEAFVASNHEASPDALKRAVAARRTHATKPAPTQAAA